MRFVLSVLARACCLRKRGSRRLIFQRPLFVKAAVLMVGLVVAACMGGPTAAATSSFAEKQDFATGTNPRSVTTGDLNGDGKFDLATANVNSNSLSVLLNTTVPGAATATFSDKQDFPVGLGPVSIATADVNGDGKLDLVIANFNANSVSVLLNTTAPGAALPSFAPKQDFATSEGPIFVAVGDMNVDGKLDLAVVGLLADAVSVLLNTSSPGAVTLSFAEKQDFPTGVGPLSCAIGDLNGDRKADLVVTNFNLGNVSVLLNTTNPGGSTLSLSAMQEFTTGDGPTSVTVADVNGDGKLDVIVANFVFNSVSVLLNTTDPGAITASFSASKEFATGTGPISVSVGDVNSDGRLDLAAANFSSNTISLLQNSTAPGALTPDFGPKQDIGASDAPVLVTVRDLNNDGKVDLAAANLNVSTISVSLNTTALGVATPGFGMKQDVASGANPRSVSVGDLNADGKLDLAVGNVGSNSISVLLNNTLPGSATASFSAKQDFAAGVAPLSITVADLNSDAKLDLVVANINSNTVSVLLNTTLPGATTVNFAAKKEFATGDGPVSVAVGDLNGDGKTDLVVANLISTVSVLFNTTAPGSAMPTFAVKHDFATGDGPRSVATDDLNGDGKLDLVVANFSSSTVAVLLNTTEPGAATPAFAGVRDFPTGLRPTAVAVGDLNSDGKRDLAVVNLNSNSLSMFLNTGDSFAFKQDFETGPNTRSLTMCDLNGDGKLDVSVVRSNSNVVSVLVNTTAPGETTLSFAQTQDFATGEGSVSLTNGDFNGDGKLDLASANVDAHTVSVLLNAPTLETTIGLSSEEGAAPVNLQIATVTNHGGNGSVSVTINSANPANGVRISNLINSDGRVTADIFASCGASSAMFSLQASDGTSTVNKTLNISVTANTAPTLSYPDQVVSLNGKGGIDPSAGPSDTGRLNPIVKQSSGTYTGDISVDERTGVVSFSNAAPAGAHTITIRATDNCGAITDASFTLTVGKAGQTITFDALADRVFGEPDFALSATATSGLPVSFAASGECVVNGNTVHLENAGLCTITASQGGDASFDPAPNVVQSFRIANSTSDSTSVMFSQSNYAVDESSGVVTITVIRTGDISGPNSVDYTIDDVGSPAVCSQVDTGRASARCDFGLTLGTLTFAPNESEKTFIIPVSQDTYPEGPEIFVVNLSKLTGPATLAAPSSATVTITDGTSPLPPNAIDDTAAFVRQQYRDFLNRDADPAGLSFWSAEIDNCDPKPQCTGEKRLNVSAAFFLSIEFQTTGNLVRSFYVAALDRPATNNMPAFEEFERDTQAMQRGLIVDPNNNAWETVLNNNRDAFLRDFVTRAEFVDLYPTTDTPAEYVDKVFLHAAVRPTTEEREAAIAVFGNATTASDVEARGRALLVVTTNKTFQEREINRSFVQMQFFGYLRRNPNDEPDGNFSGFDFWLTKLNQFNGNFQDAEMVQAFISSDEYRRRFGP